MRIESDLRHDLFVVIDTPAPLGGMAFPRPETNWSALHRLGFRRLVRLHPGDYNPSPLVAKEIALEDLAAGHAPLDEAAERDRVMLAARLAAEDVTRGEGVLVHCLSGTGRTGTVLGCALRLLGYTADEAVAAIQAHRPRWPESPWQEELVRSTPLATRQSSAP